MKIKNIIEYLRQGIELADKFAPVAAEFVPLPQVQAAAKIVDALADVSRNLLERAEEAGVVATTEDQAAIAEINTTLAVRNDLLAVRVAAT